MLKILHKFIIFISLYVFISSSIRTYSPTIDGKHLTFSSSYYIDEDSKFNEGTRKSSSLYDIGILVVNAKLTITQGRYISKEVESSSVRNEIKDEETFLQSDDYKYGLTSNIVAIGPNAIVIIESSTIFVNCPFSNGIVALDHARVLLKNTTVITKSKYSKGIVSMYYGHFEIFEDSTISTEGYLSPCLEVNKDQGSIVCGNIILYSSEEGSPLLNNEGNGNIHIYSGKGTAKKSQIIIIKGNNNIELFDCTFNGNGKSINNDNNNYNNGGIILYKSDESNTHLATLKLTNCNLIIDENQNFPLFSCYNIEADISLDNTQTNFNQYFMKASQTEKSLISTKINLNIVNLAIKGEIITDQLSQVNIKADENLLTNVKTNGNVNIN